MQLGGGCVAMAGVLILLAPDWHQWLTWSLVARALWMLGLVAAGGATYFAWLGITGVRVRHFRLKG